MRTVVILLLGTAELQVDSALAHELGGSPIATNVDSGSRIDLRSLAETLSELGDELRRSMLQPGMLRHHDCLASVAAESPGFELVLVATDQPESVDEKYRRGDTLPLADVLVSHLRDWYGCQSVRIVTLSHPPHSVDEQLMAELRKGLVSTLRSKSVERLVLMPQGGPPQLRMAAQHLVATTATRSSTILRPTPEGAVTTEPLNALVDADRLARVLVDDIRTSFEEGRFAAAGRRSELLDVDAATKQVLRDVLSVATRIDRGQHRWIPTDWRTLRADRLGIRSEAGESDGERAGALVDLVAAAERRADLVGAVFRWATLVELLAERSEGSKAIEWLRYNSFLRRARNDIAHLSPFNVSPKTIAADYRQLTGEVRADVSISDVGVAAAEIVGIELFRPLAVLRQPLDDILDTYVRRWM